MQKIYLLLRNNTQTGPFTVEELLEQELLPSDLIWVEGKSLAWSYAAELNLLKLSRHSNEHVHHPAHGPAHSSVHSVPPAKRKRHRLKKGEILPQSPHPEPKPRHVEPLLPSPMSSAFSQGDVERKAEELRQRALAAERTYYRQPSPAPTPFEPNPATAGENDIEFVYHKRGLNIPFPQILVGGLVIAMLVAGWYGQPLFRQKSDTVDATATPLTSTQENTAAAPKKRATVPAALTDSTTQQDTTLKIDSQSLALHIPEGEDQARSVTQVKPKALPSATVSETDTGHAAAASKKTEAEEEVAKEPESAVPIVVTAKKESSESDTVAEETKEKKKGFLRGLFKKKKNRDDQSAEETSVDTSGQKTQENQ